MEDDILKYKILITQLKHIAEENNISYQKIADITGISRSNISRFFAMKNNPRLDTFLSISDALEANVVIRKIHSNNV